MLRSFDVRHALPLIQAPTWCFMPVRTRFVPIAHGRYLADHINGASFVELAGGDWGTNPVVATEVAEFLTGDRPRRRNRAHPHHGALHRYRRFHRNGPHRSGDHRWHLILDAHDQTGASATQALSWRERSTPPATALWPPLTAPLGPFAVLQAISEATENLGVRLRVGLHTGECEVRGDDLGGLAVHIAARVAALAGWGNVLVSGTVKDLVVGSGIEFLDRGEHDLKGLCSGSWKLFAVEV